MLVLQRLGKRLQLRQRPIATSIVYFRRFYLKNAYADTDPYLVLATCSYVAAKLEETPVHIKSVVIEARSMFNGPYSFTLFFVTSGFLMDSLLTFNRSQDPDQTFSVRQY